LKSVAAGSESLQRSTRKSPASGALFDLSAKTKTRAKDERVHAPATGSRA